LARNVHFVTGLIESGCDFVAVDMPNANKVMIQMHDGSDPHAYYVENGKRRAIPDETTLNQMGWRTSD
jgi:hypothetical protein